MDSEEENHFDAGVLYIPAVGVFVFSNALGMHTYEKQCDLWCSKPKVKVIFDYFIARSCIVSYCRRVESTAVDLEHTKMKIKILKNFIAESSCCFSAMQPDLSTHMA